MADTIRAEGAREEPRIDWEGIEGSPEFRELVAKRHSFVIPATIFFLAYYMGFILLAGTRRTSWRVRLQGLTVGYCLALTQFVMVFVLGIWYLRKADREFDPLADRSSTAAATSSDRRAGPLRA
jgi:uncharacterized membrane protein (DUF485 family)